MDLDHGVEDLVKELSQDEHWKNLELMLQEGGCVCTCCLFGCH